MPFFGNRRRDFSIQPPRQQVDGTPFYVTDSANIDFTLDNLNLTADLTFTGVVAGTYGDATNIPVLQIDQWGRVTGVTLQPISSSGLALETNGTPNGDQTLLNLVAGTNMTITDDGLGNITFDATGGGGTYTVNNGLTENPTGNFQLGSTTSGGAPLLHDTYIDTVVNHTLYLEGQKTNNNDYILAVSNSVSGGAGILATTIGSGNAIRATSGSSSAISANSSGAPAITASTGGANAAGLFFNTDSGTNNISQGIKLWHTTSGIPAPGFGISLDYFAETISNSDLKLGRLIYQWTDPITISRTSKFQLETVNLNAAGIKLEVDGPGQLILNQYTTGTSFASVSGTSVGVLNVDSAGKVFVGAGGGGGSGSILHGTAAGTDTYTVTITGATAYADGDAYLIRFTNGNTTSATLNISDGVSFFGAVPLYRNNDGPLIGGDILDGAEMLCVYNSTTNRFQVIGTSPNTLLSYVTNDDTVTLTKGMVVFAFSGTGDRMTVQRASNLSDSTSAQTVGLVLSSSIAPNQKGIIMMQGLLDGLNILPTATWNDGDPVFLGDTPGSITKTKPYAPKHLVYLGVVTTANNGFAGRMYVKVQNGYELDELHNVQAQSPTYKDTLWYDNTVSPAQWKTASISTILGYTPGSVTSVSASVPAPASPALSVNVSNPTTTPAIAITANGTTSEYVRGDGSLATFPTLSITPYIEGELIGNAISQNSNCLDILVEPSINRLYVPFFAGNVTYIFNSSTNALVATLSTTGVNAVFYIASVNQLWVTYLSNGNISRFNATTGASAGADITGSGNRGQHYIEYSATKVFIANSASNNITVVNPSTGTVTATIAAGSSFPRSMVLNTNVASAQNDRIAVVCSSGNAMLLINPATNAITIAAVNVGSQMSTPNSIVYDSVSDRYIIGNVGNNRLLYINPATATTFTYDTYTDAYRPYELAYNSSTRYVYITQPTPALSYFNPTSLAVLNAATKQMIRQIVTSSFDSTNVGLSVITIDTTNKYVYLVSYGASARIIKIKI